MDDKISCNFNDLSVGGEFGSTAHLSYARAIVARCYDLPMSEDAAVEHVLEAWRANPFVVEDAARALAEQLGLNDSG